MKGFFVVCGLLLAGPVWADSITDFKVMVSSTAAGDLTIKTITEWNGDTYDYRMKTYSLVSIVDYECDKTWVCDEGKGSTRRHIEAFPKKKGWGYLQVNVLDRYESHTWEAISLVDHEEHANPLEDLSPSCQELYWSKDGSQVIALEGSTATAFDAQSGKRIGEVAVKDRKDWQLLLRNPCGTGG